MDCTVCLKATNESIKLSDQNERERTIIEILNIHLNWLKTRNDGIVCKKCWSHINDFHQFYLDVKDTHRLLQNQSLVKNEITSVDSVTSNECNELTIKVENIWQTDIKEPLIAAEDAINPLDGDDVADSKFFCEVLLDSKNETCSLNNSDVDVDNFELKSEEHFTNESASSNESIACQMFSSRPPKAVKNRQCKKKNIINIKNDTCEKICGTEESSNTGTKTSNINVTRKRRKPILMVSDSGIAKNIPKRSPSSQTDTKTDDEMIRKYIPMGCDLCTFVGVDFLEMKNHFHIQHRSLQPYIICCGRKLNKRFKIVQHAYKHDNPEYFKCKECNKVFADNNILRTHWLANHAPEEELIYACDKCPKRFSRQHFLELHKPSHIPINERQFSCDKCPNGKPFASDHMLQIHINMRHKRATNVCHVCAKEIRDKQSFEKHVRLHFEDSGPRVKCPRPDCDRWLKDKDNLKQHLRRHNDEGKSFVCNECGKSCKNRRSLHSHLKYSHTDKVFTCEECQKTFKKAISLKEHMAQHTGEALYQCPFCTRTFNSNANMHSHKKRMHPIQWDHWRKTKRESAQKIISNKPTATTVTCELNSVVSSLTLDNNPCLNINNPVDL